ncbi:MAG: tripartite tricarboxylate transporter substrate binding protein [Xanthobacteraceae bacterium]|nr:tripartite tricarboxylate transporter substrate binding protein [Xanthobacteraceae bacterium]
MRVKLLRLVALAAIGLGPVLLPAGPLSAQTYPERPIRFFVPFPAGGSTDAVARALAPALEKILGQPVVVENRAGAGGMLGVDAVAKAAPDGYTIGIAGAGALGVNIGERVKRPYDPVKDLALISRAAASPFILVAPQSLAANSLRDVINLAKASPGKLSLGHGGNGTAMQLVALTFVSMADVKMNLVPYRGTAPAVTDTIAGHVQLGVADPPPSMGAIREGKLKALAVTSTKRFSVFPDVPTADEMGLKDFDISGWFGVAAPKATPPDILKKLNAAVVAALNDPEVARRISLVGMEPTPSTPEEFYAFLEREIANAAKVPMPEDKAN